MPVPPPTTPIAGPSNGSNARLSLAIFAITALVFAPSLANGFVAWDDLKFIVANPRLNPPSWAGTAWYWHHVAWNLYQPITMTLWAACAWAGWVTTPDATAGHMNPAVFHLASVALHAGTAVAAFALVRRAVSNRWAAAAGTLVFALHPIQVEAVAFAGVVNNPLFGCLGLTAVCLYLRWTDPAGPRSKCAGVASAVLLLMAMVAKPTAVALVPVAWFLDGLVHHRPTLQRLRSILPWAALAVPCMAWTRWAQRGADAARSPAWQRPLVGADAVTFYLRQFAWPANLGIDYGRTPAAVLHGWSVHLAVAAFVALACIVAAVLLRRRAPAAAAGLAIYLAALLPNAGLVPFDFQLISTTADRYAYLPMLGLGLAVAAAVAHVARRSRWTAAIVVLPLLAYVVQTESQIATWHDGAALYRHALAVNPYSWLARTNLAYVVADTDPAAAAVLCRQSLAIRPDQDVTWNTLGSVLMQIGDRQGGARAFTEAHRLSPNDPVYGVSAARAARAAQSP